MRAGDLVDWPEGLPFAPWFPLDAEPWTWLPRIREALAGEAFSPSVPENIPPGLHIGDAVFIHPSVNLPPYGVIQGPAYIGEDCELRPGVFVRSNVIAGPRCVLGNSCEYKNCLLLEQVETAHFNYVGDSILGSRAHLGAGVILANLKLARDEVSAYTPDGRVKTGLRKFGAIVGAGAEVGCNAVLQPGTILGRNAVVMSGVAYHGYLADGHIARFQGKFVEQPFR